MQPIRKFARILERIADREHYLFSLRDLNAVIPGQSQVSFRALIRRMEKNNLLKRVCRGIYIYTKTDYPAGLVLYHAAARLRAHEFNYISLESVLSDAGIISQIPTNWITLMSSGRSHIIDCGTFGHIEFIHTKKAIKNVESQVTYDSRCRLWRASVGLALRQMKQSRRNLDLIEWKAANEFI
jgi:predicted transcriptional regulator of viral defense system